MTGRRIAPSDCQLPFENLHVWHRVRCNPNRTTTSGWSSCPDGQCPTSEGDWEFRRFDTVLVNTDPEKIWPRCLDGDSGVVSETCVKLTVLAAGHCVVQIDWSSLLHHHEEGIIKGLESFLAYVEHFDLVPHWCLLLLQTKDRREKSGDSNVCS